MCDCCDPTSPSPDPVVVRLEREVERLRGFYAKLYGCVRGYCNADPQVRGEAYRDLEATLQYVDGYDAEYGWPACYERKFREVEELKDDNALLRGLLREAYIGYEHNYDDASSDKRLRRVPIFHAWYERVQAALEVKP